MKGMPGQLLSTGPDESGFIGHPRTGFDALAAFLPDVAEATRWVLPELACERGAFPGEGVTKRASCCLQERRRLAAVRDRRCVCVVSAGMERVVNAEAGVLQSPDELAPGGAARSDRRCRLAILAGLCRRDFGSRRRGGVVHGGVSGRAFRP